MNERFEDRLDVEIDALLGRTPKPDSVAAADEPIAELAQFAAELRGKLPVARPSEAGASRDPHGPLDADPTDSRVVGTCDNSLGNRQSGSFYWDLITRSGQNVVAGIYLYVVEAPGNTCRGRFVIIR